MSSLGAGRCIRDSSPADTNGAWCLLYFGPPEEPPTRPSALYGISNLFLVPSRRERGLRQTKGARPGTPRSGFVCFSRVSWQPPRLKVRARLYIWFRPRSRGKELQLPFFLSARPGCAGKRERLCPDGFSGEIPLLGKSLLDKGGAGRSANKTAKVEDDQQRLSTRIPKP